MAVDRYEDLRYIRQGQELFFGVHVDDMRGDYVALEYKGWHRKISRDHWEMAVRDRHMLERMCHEFRKEYEMDQGERQMRYTPPLAYVRDQSDAMAMVVEAMKMPAPRPTRLAAEAPQRSKLLLLIGGSK